MYSEDEFHLLIMCKTLKDIRKKVYILGYFYNYMPLWYNNAWTDKILCNNDFVSAVLLLSLLL